MIFIDVEDGELFVPNGLTVNARQAFVDILAGLDGGLAGRHGQLPRWPAGPLAGRSAGQLAGWLASLLAS
mgnify:CR=1 FL=1